MKQGQRKRVNATPSSAHRNKRKKSPDLPMEVWERIAYIVGVREWAKIAGICKTSWATPLLDVRILHDDQLSAAGVAWLLKRAHHAHRLNIEQLSFHKLENLATPLMRAPCFRNLTAFVFNLDADLDCGEEEAELQAKLCAFVTRQAKQLSFLSLTAHSLKSLPRLKHLKHLQLFSQAGTNAIVTSIVKLTSLQTLHISNESVYVEDEPDLDLTPLSQLKSVSLRNLVPASLALPKGTQLHVRVRTLSQADDEIWPSALSHLRTFYIDAGDNAGQYDSEDDIPSFLLGDSKIETLVLSLCSLGSYANPFRLRGSFLTASRLAIETYEDMYVRVPEDHHWDVVNFHAEEILGVSIDNPIKFVDTCPLFSFQFNSFQGLDLMMVHTVMLHKRGTTGLHQQCLSIYHSPCANWSKELVLTNMHKKFLDMCRCQACWFCCNPWMDEYRREHAHCRRYPERTWLPHGGTEAFD